MDPFHPESENFFKILRHSKVLFSLKKFKDSPSYQILHHMHGVLNINENKLHNLPVIYKTNFLNLVSP